MSGRRCEPLTLCAFEDQIGADRIVNIVGDTVVVTKLELCSVAVEVLTPSVLIHAFHTALKNR